MAQSAEDVDRERRAVRAKRLMNGQCPDCASYLTMPERIERWCIHCDGPLSDAGSTVFIAEACS